MMPIGAAPAAAERGRQPQMMTKFPDPRRSYLDPPAVVISHGTDTRMSQSDSEAGLDAAADAAPAPKAAGPGGAPLVGISTEDLRQELVRRQKRLNALLAHRDRLTRQLDEVNGEIGALGGSLGAAVAAPRRLPAEPGAPRRARARNEVILPDAIALAVEVRATVTPAEAAELVKANGYQTTAQNFGILVAHTLAKDARFKRVERGRYERVS